MFNFGLIGAAGYIAPRHMKAIKDTENQLIVAYDPNDSIGILDSFFPTASYFNEYERFDRYVDKLRRTKSPEALDYISIASPNYLHDAHIRFALRSGSNAICEKPLVLNTWNIDGLKEIESDTGKKIYTVLQLRLHPAVLGLLSKVKNCSVPKTYDVEITYITSRGKWYHHSWKGDQKRSGGIATNIGVHFFDMLSFIFGKQLGINSVHFSNELKASGYLEYDSARVRWFLSVDPRDVPRKQRDEGQRTFRSITVDAESLEFSDGFTELHTKSYQEILAGRGFDIEQSRSAIETVATIRNLKPIGLKGEYHPILKNVILDC